MLALARRAACAFTGAVAAYGAAWGLTNVMFFLGGAGVALSLAVLWRREGGLRGAWPAVATFAGLFAVSGWRTLALPVCAGAFFGKCASASAHDVALAGLVGVAGAAVWAIVDVRLAIVDRSRRPRAS